MQAYYIVTSPAEALRAWCSGIRLEDAVYRKMFPYTERELIITAQRVEDEAKGYIARSAVVVVKQEAEEYIDKRGKILRSIPHEAVLFAEPLEDWLKERAE